MSSFDATTLGDILRGARQARGLTMEEVSTRAGIAVRTLGDLERHRILRPHLSTIEALTDALDLSDAQVAAVHAAARPPVASLWPQALLGLGQLPPDLCGFAGRAAELDAATATVMRERTRPGPMVGLVMGMAGVGKTTFAAHWAHRITPQFPDGQVYINLRGYDPASAPITAPEATRVILESLGVPAQQLPAHPDAQQALYRSELAKRRMILVLDNAHDPQQVRTLLAGGPQSLIIVTSRARLSSLIATNGAFPIHLDVLSEEESYDLLARRLGAERLAAEPAAAAAIVAHCARLPLALAIVAARAVAYPTFRLADIAATLSEDGPALDALASVDPAVDARSVFSWSLGALSPAAARLFRLLALHPGPEITETTAAVAASGGIRGARRRLAELADAALLIERRPGRYAWHELVKAFANEIAAAAETPREIDLTRQRLFDHLVEGAAAAATVLNPQRHRHLPLPRSGGRHVPAFDSYAEALEWTLTEHDVLLDAAAAAVRTGFHHHAWHIASELETFHIRSGHWFDMMAVQRIALRAARALDDIAMTAQAEHSLAMAYDMLGEHRIAHAHAAAALAAYRTAEHREGESSTLITLGDTAAAVNRPDEATRHYEAAIDLCGDTGDLVGMATGLNNLAIARIAVGDPDRAVSLSLDAIDIWTKIDDRHGHARSLETLGLAYLRQGRHDLALASLSTAAATFDDLGIPFHAAESYAYLGDSHAAASDARAAQNAWRRAADILSPFATPKAARLRGRLMQSIRHSAA